MFTVYKTTNLINGRYYIGFHETDSPNDDYLGSGSLILQAIDKYGVSNFKKGVLFTYVREYYALRKEYELVKEAKKDPLCYNLADGGSSGFKYINTHLSDSMRNVRSKNGLTTMISLNKMFYMKDVRRKCGSMTGSSNLKRSWANPSPAMIEASKRQATLLNSTKGVCPYCRGIFSNLGVLGRHVINCYKGDSHG